MPADFLPAAPLTVNWALTNRCNLNCQHCYSRTEPREDLEPAALHHMLRALVAARVLALNFGGGEPLLSKELFSLAAEASRAGLSVSLNSNGFLLGAREARALADAGVRRVGVSIDSPRAEVHDAFRSVTGSHARARAALGHLAEAGLETSLSAVICRINVQDVEQLADAAAALGCASVTFHNFKCSGLGFVHRDALDLNPDEWRAFYVKAVELQARRKDIRISLDDPVIALLGHTEAGRMVKGSVCGKLSLAIKPNGDLTPCGFIPVVVGNLLRDDLLTVWRTAPVLLRLRDKQPHGKCQGCSSWTDCLGGCSARALAMTGDFDNPDPHCWLP